MIWFNNYRKQIYAYIHSISNTCTSMSKSTLYVKHSLHLRYSKHLKGEITWNQNITATTKDNQVWMIFQQNFTGNS